MEIEQSLYRDLGPVVLLHFYDVAHAEVVIRNIYRSPPPFSFPLSLLLLLAVGVGRS